MALTQKQERFCLAYIKLGDASAAYREAYDTENMLPATVNRRAKELMDSSKIQARIEKLRAPAVKAARLTVEKHLDTLAELRDEARAAGQYGAAINAEIARGKAAGFYVRRQEITGKDGGPVEINPPKVNLSALTDTELEAYAALSAKARAEGPSA